MRIWAASTRHRVRRASAPRHAAASCSAATFCPRASTTGTLITADYTRAYEKCDVIVLPSSPRTAFKFGEISDPVSMHLSDMFTISLNIAGNGGMSMPCGLGDDTHLPIGVQLQAPQFKDENMFRVASVLEHVYGKAPIAPAFA